VKNNFKTMRGDIVVLIVSIKEWERHPLLQSKTLAYPEVAVNGYIPRLKPEVLAQSS